MPKKCVRKQKRVCLKGSHQRPLRTDTSKVEGIFRGPRTLAIMPTFRCVANCASCGTLSNPHDKTELSLAAIRKCIQEAKCLNFANIVLLGENQHYAGKNS